LKTVRLFMLAAELCGLFKFARMIKGHGSALQIAQQPRRVLDERILTRQSVAIRDNALLACSSRGKSASRE
jgi:hypothetical protein